MTHSTKERIGANKLLRTTGPVTYRLLAVEKSDGRWYGVTREGNTLRQDIAEARGSGMRPLYAVFVRPKLPTPSPPDL